MFADGNTALWGGKADKIFQLYKIFTEIGDLPHRSHRWHFGFNNGINRLPRPFYHHLQATGTKLKDPVELLFMKFVMIFPMFPHGVLIVADRVQLFFHVNAASAVSTGKRQNAGLDIRHKTDKSRMGGRGDTDPWSDFVHQLETFFIVHNFRHIQGKVDGRIGRHTAPPLLVNCRACQSIFAVFSLSPDPIFKITVRRSGNDPAIAVES